MVDHSYRNPNIFTDATAALTIGEKYKPNLKVGITSSIMIAICHTLK
ncbi:MAG: hypothetical protein ABSB78_03315 [Bacteroidota bacterium]